MILGTSLLSGGTLSNPTRWFVMVIIVVNVVMQGPSRHLRGIHARILIVTFISQRSVRTHCIVTQIHYRVIEFFVAVIGASGSAKWQVGIFMSFSSFLLLVIFSVIGIQSIRYNHLPVVMSSPSTLRGRYLFLPCVSPVVTRTLCLLSVAT